MRIKNFFIYLLNLPLYWISKIIPKDKNLWLFGAWFGEKYADNSKYLFEYINRNHPDIKVIWLTNNKDTLNLVRNKGYKAYYTYSFWGYLFGMRAYIACVSSGLRDINRYVFTGKKINLWHGIPLKKIGYDDNISNKVTKNQQIKHKIFPFLKKYSFDKMIASSNTDAKIYTSAFDMKLKDIMITGLPRNDVFFLSKKKNIKEKNYKIVYMPTFRKNNNIIIESLNKNMEYINSFLKEKNIYLYIKLHFCDMKYIKNLSYSNVKFIRDDDIEQDIYTKINSFDLLITDYSSIYFDYLLSEKPIIFAPFDYKEYLIKDRELYFDYDSVTPGPKCKNWDEVLEWVVKFKENPNLYGIRRQKIKNMFHKYQDGNFSKRVYNNIKEMITEES